MFFLNKGSSYLDIPCLLEITSKRIASIIKENDVEGIRKAFNIRNDFSSEDEIRLKNENDFGKKPNEKL